MNLTEKNIEKFIKDNRDKFENNICTDKHFKTFIIKLFKKFNKIVNNLYFKN